MFSYGATISKGSILFLELIMYKQHYDLLHFLYVSMKKHSFLHHFGNKREKRGIFI